LVKDRANLSPGFVPGALTRAASEDRDNRAPIPAKA